MIYIDKTDGLELSIDDAASVACNCKPGVSSSLKLIYSSNNQTLIDNRYFPDMSGNIVLDLRDAVRQATSFQVPESAGVCGTDEDAILNISVVVDDVQKSWFKVSRYSTRDIHVLSAFDGQCVPESHTIVAFLPLVPNIIGTSQAKMTVQFVDHRRVVKYKEEYIGESDGENFYYGIPVADLPYEVGVPFYLVFLFEPVVEGMAEYASFRSSVFRVESLPMEQYAFLDRYGRFETIGMKGKLKHTPSIEFENASNGAFSSRVSVESKQLFKQNSGYMSLEHARALQSLLESDCIYHFEKGSWKRILIDNASVELNEADDLQNINFTWIYTQNL